MLATNYFPSDSTLVWVLRDSATRRASMCTTDCNVAEEAADRWTLTVSRGGDTLVSQTCDSRASAILRAVELQDTLLRFGWTNRPSG